MRSAYRPVASRRPTPPVGQERAPGTAPADPAVLSADQAGPGPVLGRPGRPGREADPEARREWLRPPGEEGGCLRSGGSGGADVRGRQGSGAGHTGPGRGAPGAPGPHHPAGRDEPATAWPRAQRDRPAPLPELFPVLALFRHPSRRWGLRPSSSFLLCQRPQVPVHAPARGRLPGRRVSGGEATRGPGCRGRSPDGRSQRPHGHQRRPALPAESRTGAARRPGTQVVPAAAPASRLPSRRPRRSGSAASAPPCPAPRGPVASPRAPLPALPEPFSHQALQTRGPAPRVTAGRAGRCRPCPRAPGSRKGAASREPRGRQLWAASG